MLGLFVKSLFSLLAAALIAWAVVPGLEVWKLLGVAVGLSLIIPVAYPHLRGVRKGDGVMVVGGNVEPTLLFSATTCVALENGKRGDTIGISFPDGTLAEATIVSYEGFLMPARVRLLHEQRPRTVNGVTVV